MLFTRADTDQLVVLTPFSGKRPKLRVLMLSRFFAVGQSASKYAEKQYEKC